MMDTHKFFSFYFLKGKGKREWSIITIILRRDKGNTCPLETTQKWPKRLEPQTSPQV
jgi:hypothetical protein